MFRHISIAFACICHNLCDLNQLILEHCFQEKHCDMVVVVSAPAEQQPGVSDVDPGNSTWIPKIVGLVKGISFQHIGFFCDIYVKFQRGGVLGFLYKSSMLEPKNNSTIEAQTSLGSKGYDPREVHCDSLKAGMTWISF